VKKDEVWDRIKDDKDEVYGTSMLDMFLKLTGKLIPKHYEELPEDKRKLLSPEIRLDNTTSVDEADRAIKDGAKGLSWALQRAYRQGHFEMMKLLVDRGAPGVDEALNFSAKNGNLAAVRFLVSRGADVNRCVNIDYVVGELDGMIPSLRRAAGNGHLEVVKFLLEKGANDLNKALWRASSKGHLEIVELLVKKGAGDLDEALDLAASHGRLEVVDFLVNKVTKNLDRTLAAAARNGHLEVVKFLVDKGAKDLDGAFRVAAERAFRIAPEQGPSWKSPRHLEVIDYLLDRVDDPKRAVRHAHQYGHKKVVEFLKNRGAK
jgi:hypothetical protein